MFSKTKCDILQGKHGGHCSYKQTHAPLKTLHFSTRCQIDFKQVILTLYEKHKQNFFIRRMWNTIPTFATTLQPTDHFRFRHSYCKRDVKNVDMRFPCCMIGPKHMRFTEHERHIFDFCSLFQLILTLFLELGWEFVALPGFGRHSNGFKPKRSDLTSTNTRWGPRSQ